MNNRWDKEKIIKQIIGLKHHNQSYIRKKDYAFFGVAVYHFGSWKNAVEAAGFNYNDVRLYKSWEEKDILREIQSLENVTDSYVNKNNKSLYLAALRQFGSWEKSVTLAGVDYELVKKYKKWTKDKVLSQIGSLKNKSDSYVCKKQKPLYMAAIRRFGSWGNAVVEAGFDYSEIAHSYSSEDHLFEILSAIFDKVYRHYNKFDWLVFKRKMHIDFYIPEIKLAIERNGEQHYRPVCFGGISKKAAKDNLKVVRKRDKQKALLLKKHGIKLLIISYDEEVTIENIERGIKNVLDL